MNSKLKTKKRTIRINGRLREMVTFHDEKGDILHRIISPLMLEFHAKDVIQVIVGASLLAIPVALTEETWKLGENLPVYNIVAIAVLSFLFISTFIYYNYYRRHIKEHWDEFIKRSLSTYLIALLVVALILTIIEKAPWGLDNVLAIKRIVLVAFPASMSAAVADMIK